MTQTMQMKDAVSAVKEEKKNFTQTYDMIVNLQHINVEKTPIDTEMILPNGKGRDVTIGIITETNVAKAKELSPVVLTRAELQLIDKKAVKKIAAQCDYFIAEVPLMALVGKNLGPVLGPRNKMPKPLPPNAPVEVIVRNLKNTIKIKAKKSPIIQISVGSQGMPEEKVLENVKAVVEFLSTHLPRGKEQIKNIYLKSTMGKPVRLAL